MPCYRPVKGFKSQERNENGKRVLVYNSKEGFGDLPMTRACGNCTGCRLEHSRQNAMRCFHESRMFQQNCFITLTYDRDHLRYVPGTDVPTLFKKDFQDFMKRFRERCEGDLAVDHFKTGVSYKPIRAYYCGEYGEKNGRPHFHACIFNYNFADRVPFRKNGNFLLYKSDLLKDLWHDKGYVSCADFSFETAAYVARYVTKKLNNAHKVKYDCFVDTDTGEILSREPEFGESPRAPGLGWYWLNKYFSDVYPHDRVIIRHKAVKPPKYYDRLLRKRGEVLLAETGDDSLMRFTDDILFKRVREMKKFLDQTTEARLATREQVAILNLNKLARKFNTMEI